MGSSTPKEFIAAMNKGIDLRSLDKTVGNTFQQNVIWRNGAYHVRPGAGLLARYSTTMSGGRDTGFGSGTEFGYKQKLGAHIFITDQGHTQILTVHTARVFTGNIQVDDAQAFVAGRYGQTLTILVVNVYDVTTDSRAEFPLYKSTAEKAQGRTLLPKVYPTYQTKMGSDYAEWLTPGTGVVSFAQIQDNVYFTVPGHGTFVYRPIDPAGYVDRKLNILTGEAASATNFYGESSVVTKVLPSDGFVANIVYQQSTEAPIAKALCTYENRLVYAAGRYLYFSDADFPQHIIAENVQPIPTEREIKAVAALKGVILIWTDSETWLYQPTEGPDLISGGRVYNLSRNVGCISPALVAAGPDNIFWVDQWGVHTSAGGTDFKTISEPIDAMFTQSGELQNPLTSYYADSGAVDLTEDQPSVVLDIKTTLAEGSLAWDDRQQVLYLSTNKGALVFQPAVGWSYWSFESSAHNPATVVDSNQVVTNPHFLTSEGHTYIVSGPDNTTYSDASPFEYTVVDGSYSILELGRGGALDYSGTKQEDRRQPTGSYQYYPFAGGVVGSIYLGRPSLLPANFDTGNQVLADNTWLVPVYFHTDGLTAIDTLYFWATIDTDHWKFVNTGAVGNIDYILPNERIPSAGGYTNGLGEIKSYLAGAASNVGDELRLVFDGNAAPATWKHAPNINRTVGNPQLLVYIPIQRTSAAPGVNEDTLSVFTSVTLYPTFTGALRGDMYIWNEGSYPANSLNADALAQPMDWAIKTAELGDGRNQLKCRGSFVKLSSYGEATSKQVANWPFGPYNTLTSSDYRDFAGQHSDFTSVPDGVSLILDKVSIRARIRALASSIVLSTAVGGGGAKWGSTAVPRDGNLLIGSPAVDTIATSEGVRGEQFSTMIFGTLNNPAEGMKVQGIDLQVRVVGGRRRAGR